MAKWWIWGACALAFTPVVTWAQQNDTQQILDLLRGINGRFDQIEERLDRVEQSVQSASVGTDQAASSPAAAPVQPVSNGVAVPGWKIDVLPYTDQGPAAAPIARVKAPIGPTYFDLHFEKSNYLKQVAYRGQAYFVASVPGTYGFQVRTDNKRYWSNMSFGGWLKIEDKDVIQAFSSRDNTTESGSENLRAGTYLISFQLENLGGGLDRSLSEIDLNNLKQSSFEITVLDPDDAGFRPFEPGELFFIEPPGHSSAQ